MVSPTLALAWLGVKTCPFCGDCCQALSLWDDTGCLGSLTAPTAMVIVAGPDELVTVDDGATVIELVAT